MNDRNIAMRRAYYRSLGLGTYYDGTVRRFGSTIFIPDWPFAQTYPSANGNGKRFRLTKSTDVKYLY